MSAAENLAKRVFSKYKLEVPIDLEKLVKKYAEVNYVSFPNGAENFDGVTLNLKVADAIPKIYININKPKTRQRFTLAHELGHVLIPWHTGTIFDDVSHGDENSAYQQFENEADEFASELLLPTEWIKQQVENLRNLNDLKNILDYIYSICEISYAAISFKIINFLPPNYVYIYVRNHQIISHQKAKSTLATPAYGDRKKQVHETEFYKKYAKPGKFFIIEAGDYSYYWFYVADDTPMLVYDDVRTYQEILKTIVSDLGKAHSDLLSINGMVGSAKSSLQHSDNLTRELLYQHCIMKTNEEKYSWIKEHQDFPIFLSKKVSAILES